MARSYDTIVVGLGGMGSAAAYHLSSRGQRVLGLERFQLGHDRGSSHGETRIIRLAYFEGSAYVPIVQRSYRLWQDLCAISGTALIHRTGSLEMSEAGYDFVDRSHHSCVDHDLPHEMLNATEIMERFPAFRVAPKTRAIFQPDGGYLLCEDAIQVHAKLAMANGATLNTGETVIAFEQTANGGIEVRTDRARYTAGQLVLTAGPWMSQLLPQLQTLLATFVQTIAWFAPQSPELFTPAAFPVFLHFSDEGEFYGMPMHSARGVKVGGPHFGREPIDPDQAGRIPSARQIEVLQSFTARHLPQAAGVALHPTGCIYTKTPDEHFIIDRLPGAPQVLVVSPCSGHGYKFTPAIGEMIAELVVDGHTRQKIDQFSLARFGSTISAN